MFGVRVEQDEQLSWLYAVNKVWVAAVAHWHSLVIRGTFPSRGPVLIVANHVAWIDPMILSEAVIRAGGRSIAILARDDLFEIPFIGWWLHNSGGIPVRRNQADLAALRSARAELRQGRVLGTFPQATRAYGRQGLFGDIKSGPAYLAAKTGVPVVAAGLLGTGDPLWRRAPFEVRFGEPFLVPPLPRHAGQGDIDERTRVVEQAMLDLLPPSYRRDRELGEAREAGPPRAR